MPIISYSMKAPRRASDDLVVEVVMARVHVAEHGVARIAALLLDDVEHGVAEPEPARQVHHQRQAGPRLRPGGAVQRLALVGGEVWGDTDLADQADAGPVDAIERLGDDLVGDGIGREASRARAGARSAR